MCQQAVILYFNRFILKEFIKKEMDKQIIMNRDDH